MGAHESFVVDIKVLTARMIDSSEEALLRQVLLLNSSELSIKQTLRLA